MPNQESNRAPTASPDDPSRRPPDGAARGAGPAPPTDAARARAEATARSRPADRRIVGPQRLTAAFLAAAAGDALGWPYESNNQRVRRPRPDAAPTGEFEAWSRRVGGRFYACVEPVERGEYSDDTQLLLATARALCAADGGVWSDAFASAELPAWLAYERGGGGATKHAARQWAAGRAPWADGDGPVAARYFDAGGNGAAMRVLPHAYVAGGDPGRLRSEVLNNGAATHGHPRALVGALVYAAAADVAFRHVGTWRLGELLDAVEALDHVWRPPPVEPWLPGAWRDAAMAATRGRYFDQWLEVGREVDDALAAVRTHLRRGALARDHDVMRDLGAFERRISGAGTIAAAVALLLASRHAADPATGVRTAAYAAGADTDTLASMTGGLLGAMLGDEWLPAGWRAVQDGAYLADLALTLDAVANWGTPRPPTLSLFADARLLARPWTERDTSAVIRALEAGDDADVLVGPLGAARVRDRTELRPAVRGSAGTRFALLTSAGQSVYVLRFQKARADTMATPVPTVVGPGDAASPFPEPASPSEQSRPVTPPAAPRLPDPNGPGAPSTATPEFPSERGRTPHTALYRYGGVNSGGEVREGQSGGYVTGDAADSDGSDRERGGAGGSRALDDVSALTRSIDQTVSGRDLLQMLDAVMRAMQDQVGPRGDLARLPSGPEFRAWVKDAAFGRRVSLSRLSDRDIRALARLAWRLLYGRSRDPA